MVALKMRAIVGEDTMTNGKERALAIAFLCSAPAKSERGQNRGEINK